MGYYTTLVASSQGVSPAKRLTYLSEEYAELFERLKQSGISNLLDDKDTFRWLVPRKSLAGRVLNVPETREYDVTPGG